MIREFIILEDCDPANVDKIWELLPQGAKNYPQYFTVCANTKRLGQMAALDVLYAKVKTKYLYHLEDDWVQKGTFGLIERMKDAL